MKLRMISGADRQRRRRLSWLMARSQVDAVAEQRTFVKMEAGSIATEVKEDAGARVFHDDEELELDERE
jgi:hypothetical protein